MSSEYSRREGRSKVERLPKRWSEWEWSEERECHHRYRLDKNGEYEYESSTGETSESTATSGYQGSVEREIPRYAPAQDTAYGKSSQAVSNIHGSQSTQNPVTLPYGKPYYSEQHPQNKFSSSIQYPIYDTQPFQSNANKYPTQQSSTAQMAENHIGLGRYGLENPLDFQFEVFSGSHFQVGRLFKTLWAEPTGINRTQFSDSEAITSISYKFGEQFLHKIRHFVVVKTFSAHCLCLPIHTYRRQDPQNPRAQAHHYAPIYSDKRVEYKGENPAIRVEVTSPREKLPEASRINYGKVYTIEYNAKVFFIGQVYDKHRPQFIAGYQNTMTRDDDSAPVDQYSPSESSAHSHNNLEPLYNDPASSISSPIEGFELADGSSTPLTGLSNLDPISKTQKQSPTMNAIDPVLHPAGFNVESAFAPPPGSDLERPQPLFELKFCSQPVVSETANESSSPLHQAKSDTISDARSSGPSRRRSCDSIISNVESAIFSYAMSTTTTPSIDSGSSETQRLCGFLLDQDWLQTLSKEALQKVSPGKFEDNLRRTLIQFAIHLNTEATSTSSTMAHIACVVRGCAINVASLTRKSLELVANSRLEDNGLQGNSHQTIKSENGELEELAEEGEDGGEDCLLENKEEGEEDNDGDDDGLLGYKGEVEEDSKDLELLMSNSMALQMLKENLHLFVHPDPIKKALFQVWPITHPRDSTLEITYSLEWEVPHFLATYFAKGQEVGKILTITGGAINAQAKSCGDYLVQTWPKVGPALLASLQHDLSSLDTQGTADTNEDISFNMKFRSNPYQSTPISDTAVVVSASHAIHEQIILALSWIAASLRHSPTTSLAYSSASVSASKLPSSPRTIAIRIAELEEIQTDQLCWHPLLPHAVIAKGFPIRDRTAGKGLEISFPDMAMLSQSMSFTEYDNGLIVEGLRSVLIPMEALSQDKAIQWHMEHKRQTEPPELRTISEIFAMIPNSKWYKSQQPDELFQKRCFLGWAEEVAVMIGAEQFSTTEVFPSRAKKCSKKYHITKSHAFSIGTSGVGIVANASMAWQTSQPSKMTWNRFKSTRATLADEHRFSLLIYDTDQQIGWLLPRLSVILYSAYKIFTRREQIGHRLISEGKETAFKHAKPDADGASAAFSALDELMLLEARTSQVSDDKEKFSDTIEQVIFGMDKVRDGLDFANTESERIGSDLYGVELNDFLELEPPIDIKHVRVSQPWTRMARSRNCGMVLFCRGFGQPIIPTSPQRLCPSYQSVPPKRCLLATTGTVLHTFMKTHHNGPEGTTLGDTVEWMCKGACLVQSHMHGQNSPIYHEQSLRDVKNCSPNRVLLESVSRFMSGGFIFTDRSRKACSEVIAPLQSGFLDAVRPRSWENSKPIPQVPEDDSSSHISNDSETGLTTEHLQTSSISSDESPRVEEENGQLVIQRLTSSTAIEAQDILDSRQDAEYVTDGSPSNQPYPAPFSSSSTPRELKKDDYLKLGDLMDRGNSQARVKTVCDERVREMPADSNITQTVTTSPSGQAQKKGKRREIL